MPIAIQIIGSDGECDNCSYSEFWGVSFNPSRPCDPCKICSAPIRWSGHGAGIGTCCHRTTLNTGCDSDIPPDCPPAEEGVQCTDRCGTDEGFAGTCICRGFMQSTESSCQEWIQPLEPDTDYRITYSAGPFPNPCHKVGNIVAGRCENLPAVYADSSPGFLGSATFPGLGSGFSGNSLRDCESAYWGGAPYMMHLPWHSTWGGAPCNSEENWFQFWLTEQGGPCTQWSGGECDQPYEQGWQNHIEKAPMIGQPEHSVGPDCALAGSGGMADYSCGNDCRMSSANPHSGAPQHAGYNLFRFCPEPDGGGAWLGLIAPCGCPGAEGPFPECVDTCNPNDGCVSPDCDEDVHIAAAANVGYQTNDPEDYLTYNSMWQCLKQTYLSVGSTTGISDPVIISTGNNCAIKLKYCIRQADFQPSLADPYDDCYTISSADPGCEMVCGDDPRAESQPGTWPMRPVDWLGFGELYDITASITLAEI